MPLLRSSHITTFKLCNKIIPLTSYPQLVHGFGYKEHYFPTRNIMGMFNNPVQFKKLHTYRRQTWHMDSEFELSEQTSLILCRTSSVFWKARNSFKFL